MELSFSQIQRLTAGALYVSEDTAAYRFHRYTPSQAAAFTAAEPILGERAESTTGIRIDFHTNSQNLTVHVAAAGKYEVLIDDLTAFVQRFEEPASFALRLGSGEKRVTLVLPSHNPGMIRKIELDDGASVISHGYGKKIAFYGDSITQGWDSEKDSQSFAWLVSRYFDADSLILGVGGARFLPDTVEDVGFSADAVVVALGTNDYTHCASLAEIQKNCAEYLHRIASIYPDSKLFCITPIWRGDELDGRAFGTLNDVRNMIAGEAVKLRMTVVDGLTMVPHRSEYFADEYLHPNDMGFALYAQNLLRILNQYL